MPTFEMVDGPNGTPVLMEVRVVGVSNVPVAAEIDPELPYDAQWLQAAGWNPWGQRSGRLAPRTGGEGEPAQTHSGQRASGVNGNDEAPEGSPPADSGDGPDNDEWIDRMYAGPHFEGGRFIPAEPRRRTDA